jgi:hypothetical protein
MTAAQPVPQKRRDQPRPGNERERAPQPGRNLAHERPPTNGADEHIGATEDQVRPTTPPAPDDDEPKQG